MCLYGASTNDMGGRKTMGQVMIELINKYPWGFLICLCIVMWSVERIIRSTIKHITNRNKPECCNGQCACREEKTEE